MAIYERRTALALGTMAVVSDVWYAHSRFSMPELYGLGVACENKIDVNEQIAAENKQPVDDNQGSLKTGALCDLKEQSAYGDYKFNQAVGAAGIVLSAVFMLAVVGEMKERRAKRRVVRAKPSRMPLPLPRARPCPPSQRGR